MISGMMTCIDETIIHSEAEPYKNVVQKTLQKVIEKERKKQQEKSIEPVDLQTNNSPKKI